jgi:hypothetical protein
MSSDKLQGFLLGLGAGILVASFLKPEIETVASFLKAEVEGDETARERRPEVPADQNPKHVPRPA